MIGLKRGTVKLLPHNKKWHSLFEKEKKLMEQSIGDLVLDIQHIGSTSIPGIPAKPIIDISVGIRSMKNARKLVKSFEAMGYEWRNDTPWKNDNTQLLFVKGPESKRTHYVHLMRYKGKIWNNDVLFRDYLRKNKARAKKYAELKRDLAKRHANDRATYTESKSSFIFETLALAKGVKK